MKTNRRVSAAAEGRNREDYAEAAEGIEPQFTRWAVEEVLVEV